MESVILVKAAIAFALGALVTFVSRKKFPVAGGTKCVIFVALVWSIIVVLFACLMFLLWMFDAMDSFNYILLRMVFMSKHLFIAISMLTGMAASLWILAWIQVRHRTPVAPNPK